MGLKNTIGFSILKTNLNQAIILPQTSYTHTTLNNLREAVLRRIMPFDFPELVRGKYIKTTKKIPANLH